MSHSRRRSPVRGLTAHSERFETPPAHKRLRAAGRRALEALLIALSTLGAWLLFIP